MIKRCAHLSFSIYWWLVLIPAAQRAAADRYFETAYPYQGTP